MPYARRPALVALLAVCACSVGDDHPDRVAPTDAQFESGTPDAGSDATTPVDAVGLDGSDASISLPTRPLTIGIWCGIPSNLLSQARFDEMAQAGITLASAPCEGPANDATYNTQVLAFAHQAGIAATISDNRLILAAQGMDVAANLDGVVHDYASAPGLAGYFLVDEPSVPSFAALGTVITGLRTRDPAHYALVNLLPDYASAGQLGTASYDDYLAQFVATASPQVFSYDHYNFGTDGGDGAQFFLNLASARARSVASHVPFWQFIQAIGFSGHRDTNGPEKRWAALHTLAYGGTGVLYFTYWTPPQTGESFSLGLMDRTGHRTAQYAEVQSIDTTLSAIGRYTAAAVSQGVALNGALPAGTVVRAPGQPAYVPSPAPLTLGFFSVPGTSDAYVLLVNRDHTATTDSDVWLASADGAPEALDVSTHGFSAMTVLAHDAVLGTRVHVSLAAGDGLLVHLRGPIPAGAPGPEAYFGSVRADAGYLDVVDSHFGTQRITTAGWNTCPTGYTLAGRDFQSNGFWLCARNDLTTHAFVVGNVVHDAGSTYRVQGGTATSTGGASWDTCATGSLLGHRFESNGFWVCME